MKREREPHTGGDSRGVGSDPSAHWDDRLRNYYNASALSESALLDIRNAVPANPMRSAFAYVLAPFRRPASAAIAAAAMLLTTGLFIYGGGLWQQERLYAQLASEVAGNHAKKMPAEFGGSSLEALAVHFDRLAFTLIDAEPHLPGDVELLGARYCTLHGRLAAQLQLMHSSGRPQTLYIAPAGEELAGLASAQVSRLVHPENKSGVSDPDAPLVEVRLWRAGSLVFGLAADSER